MNAGLPLSFISVSIIPTMYTSLKNEGHSFPSAEEFLVRTTAVAFVICLNRDLDDVCDSDCRILIQNRQHLILFEFFCLQIN